MLSLVSGVVVGCGDGGDVPGTGGNRTDDEGGESGKGGEGGSGASDSGGSGTGGGDAPSSCEDISCVRGACNDKSGTAVCVCSDGFGGPDCEDVNECTSGEGCGVGGQCVNTFGSFYCQCDFGFTSNADSCDDVNECDDSPCAPDATCSDVAGGYGCACDDGPSYGNGYFCAASDPCAGSPCGAGATCIGTAGGHVCQCPAGKSGKTSCASTCNSLPVTDPALIQAIKAQLGIDIGAIVPAQHLAGRSSLSAVGVQTLDGLECWPGLEYLDLTGSPLSGAGAPSDPTPVAALGSLNRLRGLTLGCAALTSLDVLENHPSLTRLTVSQQGCANANALTDFSAIASLRQLEGLTLTAVELGNASFVSGLSALKTVDLSQNELASVTPFTGLPLLQQLGLSANQLNDAAALGGVASLVTLDVSFNNLDSLAWVSALTGLEDLYASNNELQTIPNLATLTALRVLFLANNQIAAVTSIANNTSLGLVDLSGNDVTDLEPLVGSALGGELGMFGNPLVCATQKPIIRTLAGQGLRVTSSCP